MLPFLGMAGKLSSRSLAATLLKVIASGGILAALLVAPNIGIALKPFLEHEDWRKLREEERRRIREEIRRLRERRLVEIAVKNGKEYLQITEAGKQRLREFEIDSLKLPNSKRWDKKWRLVMFDIPEQKYKGRRALQIKLTQLGFFPLQKSVFVYPHHCHDEVDFITTFFELQQFVVYCEADSLGEREIAARRHFSLL